MHVIQNFNINNVNLPINFYFTYNQCTNSNNRRNIRKYILTYLDYTLYNTRRNIDRYLINYEDYIINEYDLVNEIIFNEQDINIIIRFKNIIDISSRDQKFDIYNILNMHNF